MNNSIIGPIIVGIGLSIGVARVASKRGKNPVFWFFISFLISPLISWIIVRFVLDDESSSNSSSHGVPTYEPLTQEKIAERQKKSAEYEAQERKQLEEKMNSITLKEGYKFASVPSRIFAEKTDTPGSYCCPYCYTEVSSEVSSMCGNCGKSLGV
ncbi:MAG: hypothetical protein IJJ66_10970 [Treponema sp.]|nr:hypothetical protein [Treponema sp.]